MKRTCTLIAAVALAMLPLSAQIPADRDWAQFGRYAAANSEVTSRPLAVLMGDSITDGWDGKDPDFFTDNNIACRGISGQTSSQMLIRFRQDVLDLKPKYVVILAGTNDLARNTGYIAPENIMDNLASMCELARLHKIRPVLCSVTPSIQFGWRKSIENVSGLIESLNKMIEEYARENRIPYVDYHSALRDSDGGMKAGYSDDGVHPTAEAYKVMESVLLPYLR